MNRMSSLLGTELSFTSRQCLQTFRALSWSFNGKWPNTLARATAGSWDQTISDSLSLELKTLREKENCLNENDFAMFWRAKWKNVTLRLVAPVRRFCLQGVQNFWIRSSSVQPRSSGFHGNRTVSNGHVGGSEPSGFARKEFLNFFHSKRVYCRSSRTPWSLGKVLDTYPMYTLFHATLGNLPAKWRSCVTISLPIAATIYCNFLLVTYSNLLYEMDALISYDRRRSESGHRSPINFYWVMKFNVYGGFKKAD